MNISDGLIIEPLNKNHYKSGFQCGTDALDTYLKKQAGQDIKRNISRVFVATYPGAPEKIIGYYTLSSLSIELNGLPSTLVRKLPKHPIPAVLIGRLAVRQASHGTGIGKLLIADAVKRVLSVSDQIAVYALVVDAFDNRAKAFYLHFGFTPLNDRQNRLFLALKSI